MSLACAKRFQDITTVEIISSLLYCSSCLNTRMPLSRVQHVVLACARQPVRCRYKQTSTAGPELRCGQTRRASLQNMTTPAAFGLSRKTRAQRQQKTHLEHTQHAPSSGVHKSGLRHQCLGRGGEPEETTQGQEFVVRARETSGRPVCPRWSRR